MWPWTLLTHLNKHACGRGRQKGCQSSVSNSLSFYKMIKKSKDVPKAEGFGSGLGPGPKAMFISQCCFSSWVQDHSRMPPVVAAVLYLSLFFCKGCGEL